MHTAVAPTQDVVRAASKLRYIEDVYIKARNIKPDSRKFRTHPGGHVAFRRTDAEGYYNKPEECNDKHLFRDGMKSRGDLVFRRRLGGTQKVTLPPMIHLGHRRDKEEGAHLEEQR